MEMYPGVLVFSVTYDGENIDQSINAAHHNAVKNTASLVNIYQLEFSKNYYSNYFVCFVPANFNIIRRYFVISTFGRNSTRHS